MNVWIKVPKAPKRKEVVFTKLSGNINSMLLLDVI
jgi:hypothetical protein